VLAGPRDLLDGMYHGRRMFGGGSTMSGRSRSCLALSRAFSDRYSRAVRLSGDWVRALGSHDAFTIDRGAVGYESVPPARPRDGPCRIPAAARVKGVMLAAAESGVFLSAVNETLNRTTASELTNQFRSRVGGLNRQPQKRVAGLSSPTRRTLLSSVSPVWRGNFETHSKGLPLLVFL